MPPFPGKPREPSTSVLQGDAIKIRGLEVFLDESKLQEVLRRKKPTKWFWCDMTDMFGSWVPFAWIDRCFEVMANTPQHTHQVLTKRPERALEFLSPRAINAPLANVWLGTSVENQQTADERIPHLLRCQAAVRFLSCEPLLGPLTVPLCFHSSDDPNQHDHSQCAPMVNWVIVGGESGHGARPMHPDWARSLRDQCAAVGVPFFFKQWGCWVPAADGAFPDWAVTSGNGSKYALLQPDGKLGTSGVQATPVARVGKKAAGRLLDGKPHDEFPRP